MATRRTPQVANKANREAARATNTRARRERITAEAVLGIPNRGDYENRSAMRTANRSLTGQNFGNRQSRYRDLVAAFGRARQDQVDENGNLITGVAGRGGGGGATFAFSAG